MKNVKKEFIFNLLGGDGNTDCIIKTNIGQFKGDSYFNHEADKGEPSEWIGCSIAEDRAMIKYINRKIALKKAEIKGLMRFIKSYYKDPKTQAKAKNLLQTMNEELEELLYEREEYRKDIKAAIKSRETYNRLKNIDRGARDAQMKFIQESIAALKSVPSEKDKID